MVRGSTFASSDSLRYVSGMPSWKLLLLQNVNIVNYSVIHFSAEPIPRHFVEQNYMLNGYRTADRAHISIIGYAKNKQLFVTPGTCPCCQPPPPLINECITTYVYSVTDIIFCDHQYMKRYQLTERKLYSFLSFAYYIYCFCRLSPHYNTTSFENQIRLCHIMTIGTDYMAMNFPSFLKESELQAFFLSFADSSITWK